ncbi:MAG: Gfo/Idh/MocA family oxidoreductase, partial [Clostridia bacterium]
FMLAVPGRFADRNQYVRAMLEKGELGEVYYAKTSYVRRRGTPYGWFTDKKTSGGGPVIDIGIHGIDAAWYLMGTPKPTRISASTSSKIGDYQTKGVDRWIGTLCPDNKFDTEDSGCGVIHFENGAMLMFEATWALNAPSHSDTLICGSKAGVTLDPLTIYGERNQYLSDDVITLGQNDKFADEITHFADCILNNKTLRYPIEQAVLMQRMLEGIYKSAQEHKEIEI